VEFVWAVAQSGYEIVDATGVPVEGPAKPLTGRFISDRDCGGPRYNKQYYQPFASEHRTMPRAFADLADADERGFVSFANTYGPLHNARSYSIPVAPDGQRFGEPVTIWRAESKAMRCALALWSARNSADLERITSLVAEATCYYDVAGEYTCPRIDIGRMPVAFHGDPYLALSGTHRLELQDAGLSIKHAQIERLEEAYRRNNHPQYFEFAIGKLMRLVNAKLNSHVRPQLFWSKDGSGLEGHDQPTDLVGAMWHLVFDLIRGNGEHRRCLACQSWYEVSTAGSRNDRQYCSDACRMRAYRRRRAKPT
jgi:hypothetical protein